MVAQNVFFKKGTGQLIDLLLLPGSRLPDHLLHCF